MPSNQYPLIAREGWPALAVLAGLIVLAKLFIGLLPTLVLLLLLVIAVFLLRDPERTIPALPLAIVSPVHGTVASIDELDDSRLSRRAIRIRLKMSFMDIYSLRSPIEGKIVNQWHTSSGEFQKRIQLEYWISTDERDDILTVITFRKFLNILHIYLQSGERIGQGQRCGYFYFGGIVDVYTPVNTRIHVKPGDRVESGSSVLGNLVHVDEVSVVSDEDEALTLDGK